MKFSAIIRSQELSRIDFRVHDVPLCIVNAVRRAIMSEVQSVAFSYDICVPDAVGTGVRVLSNTSTLHNEMLAHRFSFVPIHLDENEQARHRTDPTRYKFSLRVKNKGAAGAAVMDVTSHDIHVSDGLGNAVPQGVRDAMFPPDSITRDHLLLVCLRPSPLGDGMGEEVAIDAMACSASGRSGCRWSPVSLCTFRNVVDAKLVDETYTALSGRRGPDAPPVQTRSQFETLDAHRCFKRDADGNPSVFDFSIEGLCGMRPEYLFFKALTILSERVGQLAQSLSHQSGGSDGAMPASLVAMPNTDDFYALTISGQGHTLGNLLQGLLYETHVRDDASRQLMFVGYHVAHPLDQSICMKLKLAPGLPVLGFLDEALRGVVARLDGVALAWIHPSGLADAGLTDVDAFLANIPGRPVQVASKPAP